MEDKNQSIDNLCDAVNSQCQISVRLLELMQKTHYQLIQENGQRRLTAPEFDQDYRDKIKGTEVFLGRLPRDCYEDELMPILSKFGRLLELRLMLDFSGSTRGYAFALFENPKIARRVCELLNGYELRPGHKIGVVKSIDNCRLFFGGVPKDKTKADFIEELGKILDGISEVYLYPNSQDPSQNRGFIFVEFKDHRSAAMARRKLIPGRVVLWDHEIAVDWADPEPGDPVDEDIMETVTVLFVRNLPLDLPHQKIREILLKTTGISIVKLKKINHFAFVHYETRELAEKAFELLTVAEGVAAQRGWEIRWAKPIGAAKMIERQRSINDAIRGVESHPKHGSRRSAGKKRSKNVQYSATANPVPDGEQEILVPTPSVNYQLILEDFVSKYLDGQCHYLCIQVYAPPGFVCKISVMCDKKIFFEYQGSVHATQMHAMNLTAYEVYHQLSGNVEPMPLLSGPSYLPPIAYEQNSVETCY